MGNTEENRSAERLGVYVTIMLKKDLKEIRWENMDWIHLAQNRDPWLPPVKTITQYWAAQML